MSCADRRWINQSCFEAFHQTQKSSNQLITRIEFLAFIGEIIMNNHIAFVCAFALSLLPATGFTDMSMDMMKGKCMMCGEKV